MQYKTMFGVPTPEQITNEYGFHLPDPPEEFMTFTAVGIGAFPAGTRVEVSSDGVITKDGIVLEGHPNEVVVSFPAPPRPPAGNRHARRKAHAQMRRKKR